MSRREEGPCSPDEWDDRCAYRLRPEDEFYDDIDGHYPYMPHPMDAAQADQRAQMEHDDELKRILHNIAGWIKYARYDMTGYSMNWTDLGLLCKACGIDIREVT